MKKQELRKYMDDALTMIKDMQKNKESSIFRSNVERFREGASEAQDAPKFMLGGIWETSQLKMYTENSTM